MHRLTLSFVILSIFLLTACGQTTPEASVTNKTSSKLQKPLNADILGLMLNPQIFDHHYVQVKGYLNIGAKEIGLYTDKEDYETSMKINALCIDDSTMKANFPDFMQLSGKYVLIEGKFDDFHAKDMSKWGGKLTDLKKLELWNLNK